jgi:DNA-binding IclR family transcriptional regulator
MSNTTELDDVLRQLDDRTNQTWALKRKRWAALVRDQAATIAEQARELEALLSLGTMSDEDMEDGGEYHRMFMDRGQRLADAAMQFGKAVTP